MVSGLGFRQGIMVPIEREAKGLGFSLDERARQVLDHPRAELSLPSVHVVPNVVPATVTRPHSGSAQRSLLMVSRAGRRPELVDPAPLSATPPAVR